MKKGLERIEQVHYVTYVYNNKEEKHKHNIEMSKKGFIRGDWFCNSPDNEVAYCKTTTLKDEYYIPRKLKESEKFYYGFKNGYLEAEDIAIYIKRYYTCKPNIPLYEYLGITKEQCQQWMTEGTIK